MLAPDAPADGWAAPATKPTKGVAVARRIPELVPVLVLLASAVLLVLTSPVSNDHFDRISRARQIAEHGEVPFRDFMDPGYFLALYASAFMQKVLGLNLLGEILLNTAAISAGWILAYLVSAKVSGSRSIAFVAVLFAVATGPRLYDYDKVLFYPLGIALCALYASRPAPSRAAALATGTVLAGLFRYDSGFYVASAAVVTLAIVHWRAWRDLGRATAIYTLFLGAVLAPAVFVVARHGSLVDAATQVMAYAQREGSRTNLFHKPGFVVDWSAPLFVVTEPEPKAPLVKVRWAAGVEEGTRRALEARYGLVRGRPERDGRTWVYRLLDARLANVSQVVSDHLVDDTAGLDRSTYEVSGLPESRWEAWRRALPFLRTTITLRGFRHAENASAWTYWLMMSLPFLAVALVWVRRSRPEWRHADRSVWTTVLAAAVLCLFADLFVLRDPVRARVGAVAVPSAVLVAWLFARPPARDGSTSGGPKGGRRARLAGVRWLVLTAGLVATILTVLSLGTIGSLNRLFRPVFSGPFAAAREAQAYAHDLSRDPPLPTLLATPRLLGLVQYLRQCTAPQDRVMATWFAPELYYFSGRAFAGGMAVFFGDHWTELKYQRRIIASLDEHMPPVVIVQKSVSDSFQEGYPFVYQFVERRYRLAAELDFDNPDVKPDDYQLFVDRARPQLGTYGRWSLPCFR